ncbi:MAG TPA: dihydrodipicolinate reductase [Vicinamibacteria bacterium]|nr:dihydrodipicolinate reductase [Vicinamibacteria bacterium]
MPTKVMIMGLGPIGAGVARQLAARKNFKIVSAVDIDPGKAGRDLGDVVGLGKKSGIEVGTDPAAAIRRTRPQVAVLCTSSALKKVWPQVEAVLRHKVPIVSTTEELSYPWYSNRPLARKIDAAAKKAKVAVVGTGVNPGFAMDALPLTLTAICERVDAVHVERVQDARIRRLPFQQKIGSGLTPAEFAEKVKALTVRHVGLTESVAMIADGLGWKLDRITDEIQPKIAGAPVESQFLRVEAGKVCGIVQDGVGYVKGKPVITLHMEAYLGAPETYDSVEIEGSPALHVKALGGYHGDVATHSIAVNTIPKALAAPPGLHTMRSLALPSFAGGK